MKVIPIPALRDNYIWLIQIENQVLCVDPGEAEPVLQYLEKNDLMLHAILLTHHHADHIGGVPSLLSFYPNIPIYGPSDNRIPFITEALTSERQTICVLGLTFTLLFIPGHTASHLCFYQKDNHWLFCGDTLFSAGCGRVFDGTMQHLFDSIQKLKALPNNTLIYCAHEYTGNNLRFAKMVEPHNLAISGYFEELVHKGSPCTLPSTIGKEKEINPFFRLDAPEILAYVRHRGLHDPDAFSVFSQLREDKDGF